MKKYREGNSYLIKEKFAGSLKAITVLSITKKAYQIRWHESGNSTWEMKDNFIETYTLVENISTRIKDQLNNTKQGPPPPPIISESKTKTTMTTCPICHGMGTVYDKNSTAGTKSCPLCLGNKMIVKDVEITQ